MKTSIVLIAALSISSAWTFAAQPTKDPTPQSGVVPAEKPEIKAMQLTVNVPPSMRPWVSDDVAEAFAARVADVLRQRGYKAGIQYLDSFASPAAGRPLLAVNLVEWRTDRIGNVDCTFSATLSTPSGRKDLGLFTGTSMMTFSRHDWFARSDQFDDAARQAINDLYKRIVETQLLSP